MEEMITIFWFSSGMNQDAHSDIPYKLLHFKYRILANKRARRRGRKQTLNSIVESDNYIDTLNCQSNHKPNCHGMSRYPHKHNFLLQYVPSSQ